MGQHAVRHARRCDSHQSTSIVLTVACFVDNNDDPVDDDPAFGPGDEVGVSFASVFVFVFMIVLIRWCIISRRARGYYAVGATRGNTTIVNTTVAAPQPYYQQTPQYSAPPAQAYAPQGYAPQGYAQQPGHQQGYAPQAGYAVPQAGGYTTTTTAYNY